MNSFNSESEEQAKLEESALRGARLILNSEEYIDPSKVKKEISKWTSMVVSVWAITAKTTLLTTVCFLILLLPQYYCSDHPYGMTTTVDAEDNSTISVETLTDIVSHSRSLRNTRTNIAFPNLILQPPTGLRMGPARQ